VCRERTKLLCAYAKVALRYSDEMRDLSRPLIGADLNLFLAAFEATKKTRDEWQSARRVLAAHVASHDC
jgi:hypothetical protein